MRLIAGLGNPGRDYEYTRHNLGFLVIRRLAEKLGWSFSRSPLANGMTAEGRHENSELVLMAPLTYMNNSGAAVKRFMAAKEIAPDDLLVVCDDFNLDFGQIRIRGKGSDGGHNGLSSIIDYLGTEAFARLRMGIGAPPGKKDPAEFVLEEYKKAERSDLDAFIDDGVDCTMMWLNEGLTAAMERYNRKK